MAAATAAAAAAAAASRGLPRPSPALRQLPTLRSLGSDSRGGGEVAADEAAVVYQGTIVHSLGPDELQILDPGHLATTASGTICACGGGPAPAPLVAAAKRNAGRDGDALVKLPRSAVLIPGMVDCHIHMPQYAFTGTGMDLPLLQWLEKYTFPAEASLSDSARARLVSQKAVEAVLRRGTTTAAWYATIHLEASLALVDEVVAAGMRGWVGKVNMDRNSPEFYIESTAQSLEDTREFVARTLERVPVDDRDGSRRVLPAITPRFTPTCTAELMKGLGAIAREFGQAERLPGASLPIQSHLSETLDEIRWVRGLHPGVSYAETYDAAGLLNEHTVMGHCVHLSEEEMSLLRTRGVAIAHCPLSNAALGSGTCPVRDLLERYEADDAAALPPLGLATDVAGGWSPSMFESIKGAFIAASTIDRPLSVAQVFYMATLGSARAMAMEERIGNFEIGKAFDACILDASLAESAIDVFDSDSPADIFHKLLFLGDDRNITRVFVGGDVVWPKRTMGFAF